MEFEVESIGAILFELLLDNVGYFSGKEVIRVVGIIVSKKYYMHLAALPVSKNSFRRAIRCRCYYAGGGRRILFPKTNERLKSSAVVSRPMRGRK